MLSKAFLVWGCAVICAGAPAAAVAQGGGSSGPSADHNHRMMMPPPPMITKAIAVMHPTEGNSVHGTVTFTRQGPRVHVVADIDGLKPNTRHGFHIHEFGDCSSPDGTSAGGHFNPMGHQHAGPATEMRHSGDMGNLEADANGHAHLDLTVDNITLGMGPMNIIGRGIIIHEKADDYVTQPTGNAGARIACGVIGIAKDGIQKPPEVSAAPGAKAVVYTCPHHPDVAEAKPGTCPKCGMALVERT